MTNSTATKPTVIHSTFQLERKLRAAPERVFAAFADEATKRRWFYGNGPHASRTTLTRFQARRPRARPDENGPWDARRRQNAGERCDL